MAKISVSRIESRHGVQYKTSEGSLNDAVKNMCSMGFVALSLQGHEGKLFHSHASFKSAVNDFGPPIQSPSQSLEHLADVKIKNLELQLQMSLPGLLQSILKLPFTEDSDGDEHSVDMPYLQDVLLSFVAFPQVCYNQVHLEYCSTKNLVGGSFDVIVGSSANGKRPNIELKIKGSGVQKQSVYLGSVLESKSASTRLSGAHLQSDSFDESTEEFKPLLQPMLELMALSEMTTFPDPLVPLVCIYGNKFVFRPLLYFKSIDVMLTTPRVVKLRPSKETLNLLGLVILFTVLHLHRDDIIRFRRKNIKSCPVSGWKDACNDHYSGSELSVAGAKRRPHVDDTVFLHESTSKKIKQDEAN